jgi:protein-S-isoprenylcysteine O-methyltransferase Ste14
MIDPTVIAVILVGYLALFFSVHGYMDVRMMRKKSQPQPQSNEFIIPLWAQILAFPPSFVFWVLFFVSPYLFYSGGYRLLVTPFLQVHGTGLQSAGLFLILTGVLLADWGRISRGVIAPSTTMPQGYTLATKGAYRIVRHPMYVSYSLFFLGLPLILLSAPFFVCIVGIFGYYRIAKAEEDVLLSRFGDAYKEYQEKVGMFFPKG